MSIASLLRHHGVHVPRYVTVDGQIVFDNVSVTPQGVTHQTLGPVTPVPQHTFHGGIEPQAAQRNDYWWEDPAQLGPHVKAMQAAFPAFSFQPPGRAGGPAWTGVINTGRGKFRLTVALKRDKGLPRARVAGLALGVAEKGLWVPAPHLYLNGNLCIADRDDWDPHIHTAATAVAWSAHWLAAYTEWRMSRQWPIEGFHSRVA